MSKIDLKINKTAGYYDISFVDGDFEMIEGFSTALQMSLFCERRASVSEISVPQYRRGWWGNITNDIEGFEIGSKLWLLYQARNNDRTANLSKTYTGNAVQWLVEDEYINSYAIEAVSSGTTLTITVNLLRNNNILLTESFDLWHNTKEGLI